MGIKWHLIDEHEIVGLIADHADQRRLCHALEHVADALPNLPTPNEITTLARQLTDYSRKHYPIEESLFQRLEQGAGCPTVARVVDQIRDNHAIDGLHADDLAAELGRLSGTRRTTQAGELSYMLRCFFDGCRRAIAFEELALMKLGQTRLTPAAQRAVANSIATR